MINSLIVHCWENGSSYGIYFGIQILAVVVQILFLIFSRKAYGLSFKRAALISGITYPFLFLSMYIITWAEYGFTNWGANNVVRVYMWTPLLLLPFSKLFKVPHTKLWDYFAPSFALSQAVGHIGCPFEGCCYGYPCSWGIYNPILHERLFPIQWVECLGAFLLWWYLIVYARKKGYEGRGKVLALFLILYGLSRFVFEFFRDNTKLFWGISELAIWAFLAFVTGCMMLLIINRRQKKNA